jgi:hypothetical protein
MELIAIWYDGIEEEEVLILLRILSQNFPGRTEGILWKI